MSNQSLAERNEKIRKRMLDVSDVKLVSCPPDSPWLKPLRLSFKQDGKFKIWDFVKAHDSVSIIIFNISRKKLVFVRQFRPVRYYSYFSNDEKALNQADVEKYPASLGLAIELCGGIVDKNKSLVEIVQEEVLEECGYEVPLSAFEKIITYQYAKKNFSIFKKLCCKISFLFISDLLHSRLLNRLYTMLK